MKKAKRVGKIIRISTFKTVKRGNWLIRFSCTDMGTIMLLARSVLTSENCFIKFFNTEESAASFADFLVKNDFYDPDPFDPDLSV